MLTTKSNAVIAFLEKEFPGVGCELSFSNAFECLVAISLSAQTTDKSVNKVTPLLFEKFPTPFELARTDQEEVEAIIQPLGLYKNKARNVISLANDIVARFGGVVPTNIKDLTSLSGVGTKTAGVFLLEIAGVQAIPVDTHVHRVSDRLGYSKPSMDPYDLQLKLQKAFPKEKWGQLHHQMIHFGRKICHAKNPQCDACELHEYCVYFKKTSSIKGK